jgi:hypothetical protein
MDPFIYVSPQAAWFSIVRTVSPQFEDKAGKNVGNDRAGATAITHIAVKNGV